MNRAELMLSALTHRVDGRDRDGWLSRQTIFDHCGTFFLTNNAASELRALGYDVEQRRHEGNYEYRVSTAEPSNGSESTAALLPPPVADGGTLSLPSSAVVEQLTLEAA